MNLEYQIFHFLNHTIKTKFFDVLMSAIGLLGEKYILAELCVILFILSRKGSRRPAAFCLMGIIITFFAVGLLKVQFNRPRPFAIYEAVNLIGKSHSPSFPSGHAALAFTAAVIWGHRYRRLRASLYTIATLVGVSRVYAGLHYPSDVLCGAILGWAVGIVLVRFVRRKRDVSLGEPGL